MPIPTTWPGNAYRLGSKGGKIGGKRSLETMTPEERSAHAKRASEVAARKRTAARLARERAGRRK
jgi:hypothetical protein